MNSEDDIFVALYKFEPNEDNQLNMQKGFYCFKFDKCKKLLKKVFCFKTQTKNLGILNYSTLDFFDVSLQTFFYTVFIKLLLFNSGQGTKKYFFILN